MIRECLAGPHWSDVERSNTAPLWRKSHEACAETPSRYSSPECSNTRRLYVSEILTAVGIALVAQRQRLRTYRLLQINASNENKNLKKEKADPRILQKGFVGVYEPRDVTSTLLSRY